MDPAAEYIGVEIPRKDLAGLVIKNEAFGLFLDQWAA